jgi:hypothetical protein
MTSIWDWSLSTPTPVIDTVTNHHRPPLFFLFLTQPSSSSHTHQPKIILTFNTTHKYPSPSVTITRHHTKKLQSMVYPNLNLGSNLGKKMKWIQGLWVKGEEDE